MIYIILFFFSFLLTYLIKYYAIKKSLFDIPNQRSSHTIPTPHGGGIAIAMTWFIGLTYLYYTHDIDNRLYNALMTGLIISAVSYLDDLYELSAKLRIIVQSFSALLGLYFIGGFETLDLGLFTISNQIFTNIFAFFLIVWFINLYNFLDSIDGYAGSEAIFLAISGFVLYGDTHFLILISAVFGFLIWNWHKAKIFMGDVGSTLLGYNVAIFTLYYANETSQNFWIWIILFGVFWFDATITLFRRYKNREKLSQAHKKHAYQRLYQSDWSHSKIVLFSVAINIILLGIVYALPNVFIAFFIAIILLYCIMRFIDSQQGFKE